MIRAGINLWLRDTPLRGGHALLCALACLAVPTAIRTALSGVITGCEFTPYLPFVFLAALMMRWWQAAALSLACVVIFGGLFVVPPHDFTCFMSSAGLFLASSAAIIGIVAVLRTAFGGLQRHGAQANAGDIVFSLKEGEVWASWYGQEEPLRLGTQHMVSQTMKDFLSEGEIGERLNRPQR